MLNVIAPCSVTEFKDTALEYICLQLEAILENHLLNDLEEELLLELDDVVRANQLNCLPFAKSGRAERLLLEQYPELAEDILEERHRRVKDMTFRANLQTEDSRTPSSFRARVGSLDDILSSSPSQEKSRRKSKAARNAPFSPSLRPKDSVADLMFDMDEDANVQIKTPRSPPVRPAEVPSPALGLTGRGGRGTTPGDVGVTMNAPESPEVPATPELGAVKPFNLPGQAVKTWTAPALDSTKLDLREIMSQASSNRTSALSMSISAQKAKDATPKPTPTKLSQKERKKQQQQAAQHSPSITVDKADNKPSSPWQVAARGPKTSLKDVLDSPSPSPASLKPNPSPIHSATSTPKRTASPDTRFAGQRRTASATVLPTAQSSSGPSRPAPAGPHSKSYVTSTSRAEPSLQLSMADIIGQQKREQEVIKEAVAKRSLQEIQEEQAFQEWWDAESKRTQEEAASRSNPSAPGKANKAGGGEGGRGKSSGRAKGRGRGGGGGGPSRERARGRGQEKVTTN
jgi:hypothetical protein